MLNHSTTNMNEEQSERAEYWESIDTMADVVENRIDANGGEVDDIHHIIWQTFEGSEYVIYYSKNLQALQYSENEPEEFMHLIDDSSSYQEVLQAMAHKTVEADVYDELRDRDVL